VTPEEFERALIGAITDIELAISGVGVSLEGIAEELERIGNTLKKDEGEEAEDD